MIDSQSQKNRTSLAKLIFGYQPTVAIYLAVKAGIPEILSELPCDSTALAERASLHPESTHRLMRALTSLGLFAIDQKGEYHHTEKSRLLLKDHPNSLAAAALYQGSSFIWQAWGNLEHSLHTGENAFQAAFGKHLFSYFEESPNDAEIFNSFMSEALPVEDSVARNFDFSRFQQIVDIAGGCGTLLNRVLSEAPDARGILFDQPQVIEEARKKSNLCNSSRVTFQAGSFFDSVPEADLMIMKYILHDWDDTQSMKILNNCSHSLSPEGRLLIIEKVVPASENSAAAAFSDLMMLATTGGKERTLVEYQELLHSAGFTFEQEIQLWAGTHMSILEFSSPGTTSL